MVNRTPAAPLTITGFKFIKNLGQGGFADVFLYQQLSPQRLVAIKVLISKITDPQAEARLSQEADAMAGLSQHQNIVTVFQMGVADDGRAYLVMEYYPGPTLAQELRRGDRSLASVLSIGVQLAGAVESAHRLGILHRDLKPANIMMDRVGRPVLGDFGISISTVEAQIGGAVGLSIPYSPPESFDADRRPLPQSDVWGLAATVYSLLCGRAPFEIPGGENSGSIMMHRIRYDPYWALEREDVPQCLNQVLATAMAKNPESRYGTMQDFGLAINQVETELRIPHTVMEIIDPVLNDDNGSIDITKTQLRPIALSSSFGTKPAIADKAAGSAELSNHSRFTQDNPGSNTDDPNAQGDTGRSALRKTRRLFITSIAILVVIIGIAAVFFMTFRSLADVVPDSEFKACLNLTYLLQPGQNPITAEHLMSIEAATVACDYRSIASIQGAQYLKNVTILQLQDNAISDLKPLTELTNLKELNLSNNQISDFTPLTGLVRLDSLYAEGNQVKEISPLANLTTMTDLRLASNTISDITPLAALINLNGLDLAENQINDISGLAGLVHLVWIDLTDNYISDIGALANLTELETLRIENNMVADYSPVEKVRYLYR